MPLAIGRFIAILPLLPFVFAWTLTSAQAATTKGLSSLAAGFNSLEKYSTWGGCQTSPMNIDWNECNVGRLGWRRTPTLRAHAFLSATDILLEAADKIDDPKRSKEIPLEKLLKDYDHIELLAATRLSYAIPWFEMGAAPFQSNGQFLLHNPNLPLATAVFRQDLGFFIGVYLGNKGKHQSISVGARLSHWSRKEALVEANLLDVASQSKGELVRRQKLKGAFVQIGAQYEALESLNLSLEIEDLGRWYKGSDFSHDYLFVSPDKRPRALSGISFVPSFFWGQVQVGILQTTFLDGAPPQDNLLIGNLGYFFGPTRIVASFGQGLFRSAFMLKTEKIGLGLGQEWENSVQSSRSVANKFTAQLEVSL